MQSIKLLSFTVLAATVDCAAFAAMERRGLPSKFVAATVTTGKTAKSTLRLKYWN
ncbi:hypothetical protein Q5Y75_14640 [Ruegeria sp. 2205SS24-7]|uniref:hypothetical protein n=1 Tax=Ruegeria discodermiae TaxID=3064389 RepID=UPI0027410D33|nr:hypothetical protein [Ruegeria sp. 2205SS24-7]MDP5218466.1 hypothetical protein [Ruegeria sp. 2205SS24-7]